MFLNDKIKGHVTKLKKHYRHFRSKLKAKEISQGNQVMFYEVF